LLFFFFIVIAGCHGKDKPLIESVHAEHDVALNTEPASPFWRAVRPIYAGTPVGAGDSFDAGFLHEYLRGSDVKACLAAGNLAVALSVTRAGGAEAFRDAQRRERFLQEHRAFHARSL